MLPAIGTSAASGSMATNHRATNGPTISPTVTTRRGGNQMLLASRGDRRVARVGVADDDPNTVPRGDW
ncbi:MAG: hypothetical protein JNL82_19505 [Myxococcales bacterium]|nr:hypothetical protein [Myxococcales bacterium]